MSYKPSYKELEKKVEELEQRIMNNQLIEKEQLIILEVLQLINETESLKEILKEFISCLKKWSGCEAVGLRLKEGPDFPYFVTNGFPDEFIEKERYLCSYELTGKVKCAEDGSPLLECMCGNIICGRFDPAKNFFTEDGSFWSNCTTRLLATTTNADRQARTRNRCNSSGYESVALIPLRSAGETFGLIQLNDHEEGKFSSELITMYRRVADYIAGFLAKRQAREALKKSEMHLRTLIDTLPDLVWLKDPEGTYLLCNPRFEQFFDAKEEDITGKTDYDFMEKALADYFRDKDKAAMAAGKPCINEEEITFATDGHHEILETIKTPVYDQKGRIIGALGIARDITQRKKNEEALQYQEQLLQEMGSIAKIGAWEFDPLSGKGTWTEEVARIHDLDPDIETNMELGLSFYPEESLAKINNAIKEAIEHGTPYDLELELVSAKQVHKWVRTVGKPKIKDGSVIQVRGSFQDITESKIAMQNIEHLNRVLKTVRDINQLIAHEHDQKRLISEGCRLLVENRGYASALMVRTDKRDKPISWSSAGLASSVKDLDHMLEEGKLPPCFNSICREEKAVLVDKTLGFCDTCPVFAAAGSPEIYSLCVRLSHGEENYGYLAVALDHRFAAEDDEQFLFNEMARDLAYALGFLQSERKRKSLEDQLVQAQKMESVGRLAGGVAHDLNNLLSPILLYSEMILEDYKDNGDINDSVKEIYNAGYRARDLVRQLLAFSRKQALEVKTIDLNDVVANFKNLIRRTIPEDIEISFHLSSNELHVLADVGQIEQVIMNLSVNAADAMPEGGALTIETSITDIDEVYAEMHPEARTGRYAIIAINDTGKGMDNETQKNIFEPFFSTKGKLGTGLGLATVHGIIKQHNGNIWVYSEPGKGSTFKIYLPIVRKAIDSTQEEETQDLRGFETILLVEDNEQVRKLAQNILLRWGYEVISAGNSDEAQILLKRHNNPIQLLLTDVVLTGKLNGKELYKEIRKQQHQLKALYMSGYTDNIIVKHGVLKKGINFIQKPFSNKSLAEKVRKVLDEDKKLNR
ncbi:MAG: PAS domain-containing protein [Desulfobacteraceae bacterium]|jgi:PAS domain S-box-containing protein